MMMGLEDKLHLDVKLIPTDLNILYSYWKS